MQTRISYVYSESLYLLCSSCSTHVAIQLKGPRIPRNDSSRAVHQTREVYPILIVPLTLTSKATELYHRDTVSPGRNN